MKYLKTNLSILQHYFFPQEKRAARAAAAERRAQNGNKFGAAAASSMNTAQQPRSRKRLAQPDTNLVNSPISQPYFQPIF